MGLKLTPLIGKKCNYLSHKADLQTSNDITMNKTTFFILIDIVLKLLPCEALPPSQKNWIICVKIEIYFCDSIIYVFSKMSKCKLRKECSSWIVGSFWLRDGIIHSFIGLSCEDWFIFYQSDLLAMCMSTANPQAQVLV